MVRALLVALSLFVATATTSSVAAADPTPRVSLVNARRAALARVPGTVVGEKLKHKKKWPHPIWSIKIEAKDGTTKKVVVDSDTGKVMEIKPTKSKKSADDTE
jgi:uncharacterized membrane protein YkoI